MRLLIIEDEPDLIKNLKKGLEEKGFAVDTAYDGEEGKFLAETETYDLIVLDIMLPKIDGLTICRNLRKQNITTPILILTAKSKTEEIINGLNSGADDYITKPFSFLELTARIYTILKRSNSMSLPALQVNDLILKPQQHEVSRNGKALNLTPKEFSILELLMRNKNKVVTRTYIIEHVWDYNFESVSNLVDVLIGTLRKKVEKKELTKLIHTVYGVGFKISENTQNDWS